MELAQSSSMVLPRTVAPLALVLAAASATTILLAACSPALEAIDDPGPDGATRVVAEAGPAPDASEASTDAGNPLLAKCNRLFDAALRMANRCGEAAGMEPSGKSYHASDRSNYVGTCLSQASAAGYDASRLDACLGEAESTTLCVDLLELSAPFNPSYYFGGPSALATCLQGPGTLAAGAGCAYASQCASARCESGGAPGGAPYCGKCAAIGAPDPAPAAVGQACDATRPCVSGATCAGTCQVPGAEGEPCPIERCAAGLACTGLSGEPRVCKRRQPLGASCAGGLYCQSPLWCISDTCVNVKIGKPGDDCSFTTGNNVSCEDELTCMENAGSTVRTCVSVQNTVLQVGEACDLPTSGKPCARSLWCVNHTCQQRESNLCKALVSDAGTTDAGTADAKATD